MAGQRSPYDILGVSPDAEPIVIEAAYKALIKKYHPDLWLRDPGAQERAATINEAFAILRNPKTRSLWDERLRAMRKAAQAASYRQAKADQRGLGWWSGWLVALTVVGVTTIPWDSVSLPVIQYTPQPAPIPVASVTPSNSEKPTRRARELATREKPLPDGLVQLATKAREQQSAFLASMDEPAARMSDRQDIVQPARRYVARKRSQMRPRPAPANSADAEFREREGFIY